MKATPANTVPICRTRPTSNRTQPGTTEFCAETRTVKLHFFGLALFLAAAFTIAGVIGRQPWNRTLLVALVFPFGFLAFFWVFGAVAIFDRCYTISPEGITVSRRGRKLQHITLRDVARVSKGHLCVVAYDGRKISFNLPPAVQTQARDVIEERLRTRDDAAEQTG